MYGLIGKLLAKLARSAIAVTGQRESLIAILREGLADMPGCLSYIVARDLVDVDALWITEVWDSQASHERSLALPSVQQAIARGRPLIATFGERIVTEPVGGHGLVDTQG